MKPVSLCVDNVLFTNNTTELHRAGFRKISHRLFGSIFIDRSIDNFINGGFGYQNLYQLLKEKYNDEKY